MSEQKPRPSESTLLSSTRHMLDELDELMERMLALPVNELEVDSSSPAVEETGAASSEHDQDAVPPEQELAPEPAPSYHAEIEEAPVTPYSGAILGAMGQRPAENDGLPSLEELRSEVTIEGTPRKQRRGLRVLLQPLFWVNRTFDVATFCMGGAGRWLRGARGRSVLGYAGLGLLLASLLWLFRGLLGWPN